MLHTHSVSVLSSHSSESQREVPRDRRPAQRRLERLLSNREETPFWSTWPVRLPPGLHNRPSQTQPRIPPMSPAHGSGGQKPGHAQAGVSAQGLTGLPLKCLIWSWRSSEPIQIVAGFSSLHRHDWGHCSLCWLPAPSSCPIPPRLPPSSKPATEGLPCIACLSSFRSSLLPLKGLPD